MKAIDDRTVDDSRVRNREPAARLGLRTGAGKRPMVNPGKWKSAKVEASTANCSRQWDAPARSATRDSFAACRKNSRPMPIFEALSSMCAASPRLATRSLNARQNAGGERTGPQAVEGGDERGHAASSSGVRR
ncbi:hypothetical protein IVB25_38240 [Bradyrhizobium sp. 193]|uniref:hypothetical protein n=1 Tax=Bradyrhizobium sp. 193 TaxID=2782661 RepID=UPI002096CC3A|nr:hypothetical protein [Bradyrhizobium sp. 193]MCK1488357.1 hypothetical protein [Bradyrhizobium sp. 193]